MTVQKKQKQPSVRGKAFLMFLGTTLMLIVLLCAACVPTRYDLRVGSISPYTITATKGVVDEVTTEERRKAAASLVEPTYALEEGATENVMTALNQVFTELRAVVQYGEMIRGQSETPIEPAKTPIRDEDYSYAQKLITTLSLSRYQYSTLMRSVPADYEDMVNAVTLAVQNALNASIREGQVSQSIQTITQLVGYRVQLSLQQNIVPAVLRACVKANMVIVAETTEQARQNARDSVEPVTYLQGQNIIRAGEIVTQSQYRMLDSLGLLDTNKFDLNLYIGAALVVLLAMAVLLVQLHTLWPKVFSSLRKLGTLLTVILLTTAISIAAMKLIHVDLVPSVMAAILLADLLGGRAGIAGTFCIAILVSGLSISSDAPYLTTILHLIANVTGGIISVWFIRQKPHRLRILLCSLLAAAINALIVVTVHLMTSADLRSVTTSLIWYSGSGLLGGLLALGFQPVLENLFNLPTTSKLLELTNPNHPLLRRLLLEAPGTYHHSILVANLAEAAAEKVHAKPLLARTAAYYHDIGKLKRPQYFKENQIGENVHDSTDPYVSAAVLTAHTKEGAQLARKYHLPEDIVRIVGQHHGNTPVMYFYHKACQQNGEQNVNINDFRYDGRHPDTKEAAIVMLADTVEAAVRSLSSPTPEEIEKFIIKLVRGKLEDDQLSDAPLTLQDLDNICSAFCTVLNGAFHERIEYPDAKKARKKSSLINNLTKNTARKQGNKSAPQKEQVSKTAKAVQKAAPQADTPEAVQKAEPKTAPAEAPAAPSAGAVSPAPAPVPEAAAAPAEDAPKAETQPAPVKEPEAAPSGKEEKPHEAAVAD